MKYYRNYWCEPNSVESCLKTIISLGFDYEGEETIEGLKALVDELVRNAKDGLDFLFKEKFYYEELYIDEDYQIN